MSGSLVLPDYRALFEHAADGMVVVDASMHIVETNAAFANLIGAQPDQLIGRSPAQFIMREELKNVPPRVDLLEREGEVFTMRRLQHSDGSLVPVEILACRLPDGRSLGIVRDLRRRPIAESTPIAESRLHAIGKSLRVALIITDRVGHALYANEYVETLTGYRPDEIVGKDLMTTLVAEHDRAALLARAEARHASLTDHFEVTFRHKDGRQFTVSVTSSPTFDSNGACIGSVAVIEDVTEQLHLREGQRLMQEQLLLAQKMEAVGSLAGGVAHDVNNLLSVILGAAESIERELGAESPLREDVKDIRDATERGAALTRQLLSLGRREVRAPTLLDVNQVVTSVTRLLLRALGPRVSIDVHRGEGPLSIVADAGQIEQVLVNLAINARDAMPDGGVLTLQTERRDLSLDDAAVIGVPAGRYVALVVSDTGTGMDATTRARAFEPFYTTKGPNVGTGLGLSTVYAIVRQSGGGITMDSSPGMGTRFALHFPMAAESAPAAELPQLTGEHMIPRRGRVLLVEDEPRVRSQTRRLLERAGFQVTDAPDGAEGVFQFRAREGAVDVVVSDVMMPVMGGVEMIGRLRTLKPDVPVVLVSGYTADDRDLPLDQKTLYVPKPYTIETLCEAIDRLLAR
ncbi:MAG TPA: PAS domain S-box protein [Gemmatimonadaceae bacterium]